jgi:uncharacterized protein YegL
MRDHPIDRGLALMSLSDFVPSPVRSLPVVVLADVSGSMSGRGKLAAQSQSIAEMIDAFSTDDATRGAVQLAVITFGGQAAEVVVPLRAIADITWDPGTLAARGKTPWGAAIALAQDVVDGLVEPTFQPTIVMTSDGMPTDAWEPLLERFLSSRRGAQSHRYAIAIGEDADAAILERFAGDSERVLAAGDAAEIVEYFRRITMSVTQALIGGTYDAGLGDLTDDF